MLTGNIIFISLTIILFFGVKSCNAKVTCASCPMINVNLTTDADLNTQGCTMQEDELCSLILRVDYTNGSSFAIIDGSNEPMLVLTNGEPLVSEVAFIWFDEMRVQRMANIVCFAGASCGLDLIKQIYKEKFRPFDYEATQNRLADQLYSSSATTELTCADPSGLPISCTDGFCRSVLDGNGLITYSTCVKKGLTPNPYGITVTTTKMADFNGEQVAIVYTCNKPMCNSKEASQQILQQLTAAQIIPEPVITTTTVVPTTTSATVAPTTTTVGPTATETTTTIPKNIGIKMLNGEQKLLVSFFLLFSIFKFF